MYNWGAIPSGNSTVTSGWLLNEVSGYRAAAKNEIQKHPSKPLAARRDDGGYSLARFPPCE
jgi:hypothetical protein